MKRIAVLLIVIIVTLASCAGSLGEGYIANSQAPSHGGLSLFWRVPHNLSWDNLAPEGKIAIVVAFVFAVVISSIFVGARYKSKISRSHPNTVWFKEATFEENIKKSGLKPQKTITYGQNYFAYDRVKKKILIQSPDTVDAVHVSFNEVVSYELEKDGAIIASGPEGAYFTYTDPVPDEDGVLCHDLKLTIKTKTAGTHGIAMTFIASPEKSGFVYKSALEAAEEIIKVLDGLL